MIVFFKVFFLIFISCIFISGCTSSNRNIKKEKDLNEKEKYASRLREISKDSPERFKIYYHLGEISYKEKKFNDALIYFSKIYTRSKIKTLQRDSLYYIGQIFERMNNTPNALASYKELSRNFPEFSKTNKVEEKINLLSKGKNILNCDDIVDEAEDYKNICNIFNEIIKCDKNKVDITTIISKFINLNIVIREYDVGDGVRAFKLSPYVKVKNNIIKHIQAWDDPDNAKNKRYKFYRLPHGTSPPRFIELNTVDISEDNRYKSYSESTFKYCSLGL